MDYTSLEIKTGNKTILFSTFTLDKARIIECTTNFPTRPRAYNPNTNCLLSQPPLPKGGTIRGLEGMNNKGNLSYTHIIIR
jgi:hypothetical protein